MQRARTHARYTSSVTVSQLTFEMGEAYIPRLNNTILEIAEQRSSENNKHLFQWVEIYLSSWLPNDCWLENSKENHSMSLASSFI